MCVASKSGTEGRNRRINCTWGYYGRRIIFRVGTGVGDFRVAVYNVHGFNQAETTEHMGASTVSVYDCRVF